MGHIVLSDVSYIHPAGEALFHNISFSVPRGAKVALVGDNGSGKSTLIRLLSGELAPASGEISLGSKPCYIPQHSGQYGTVNVAGALGIADKLQALHAILGGDASERNYTVLGDDWNVEERVRTALSEWGLSGLAFDRGLSSLSGGEKTRLFLAGAVLHEPEIILLDEPSNHLDAVARSRLYRFVEESRATMLIVSHDRTLLNLLDTTLELTYAGITTYGGNYEFYRTQKEGMLGALQDDLREKEKALRAARDTARKAAERKQRMDSRGEKKKAGEGVARIMMNTLRNSAEASASRLKEVHTEKIGSIRQDLHGIRSQMPGPNELKIKFGEGGLHRGKTLIAAENINFGYGSRMLWSEPLTFKIFSGDRIAIKGGNGSGKTTLLKLILGQLQPSVGEITRAPFSALYIDQEYSLIDNRLTVFGQASLHNTRNLPEHEVKTELHRFLLPAGAWDKPCGALSGGEKMKLIFCCLVLGNSSPDLFILDEPTNNLDIRSLEIVTSALKGYRGTLLVISHDNYFLEETGIDKEIEVVRSNM